MALDYISATDTILSTFRVAWNANSPALVGGSAPAIVYEATEPDLKPHPRDGTMPWTRIVVRHNGDASTKVTLNNDQGTARYRRLGLAWVQIFVPNKGAEEWTLGQQLAKVALGAFEGKRKAGVLFTKAGIFDRPRSGPWLVFDVKVSFYWDEIK